MVIVQLNGQSIVSGQSTTIFFFSPETNVNNYGALKSEFDSYFSTVGTLKFQPFSSRTHFEAFLAKRPDGLFLMSSWHYQQLVQKDEWNPVLVGVLKGKTTQKHLLFAPKELKSVRELGNLTIAASGSREFSETLLREILGEDADVIMETIEILVVPKDIDALMAIGYGVAGAAIATENGVKKLSQINPKQLELLHPLGVGPDSLLPVVVVHQDASMAVLQKIITILQKMGAEAEGRQRLKMLGLDGMIRLAPAHKEALRE